ncbi:SDR family oxidoreductase [Cohnella soli]|uniref:dTDP-4-dehydrorhamnose reductase n=1 Tax=Cohnella soli TaxID=425005 RepID=A0ABW0HY33_9BACL
MKIVVLGGNGMAGHMIADYLKRYAGHEVIATVRPRQGSSPNAEKAEGVRVVEMDALSFEETGECLDALAPDIIVNAVGILNHRAEERPLDAYKVNGLLPHWLRHRADRIGARLIHISSDCVFSGNRGHYREDDAPDGTSVYARSKALGEVRDRRHATIRTSIIGPDRKADGIGLMQWFLSREGEVGGYTRVLWNGVTTLELAKATAWLIEHPRTGGLLHLTAAETVSKYDLLLLMQEQFDKGNVTVVTNDNFVIDRTLVATRADFVYQAPGYREMLQQLRQWMTES